MSVYWHLSEMPATADGHHFEDRFFLDKRDHGTIKCSLQGCAPYYTLGHGLCGRWSLWEKPGTSEVMKRSVFQSMVASLKKFFNLWS